MVAGIARWRELNASWSLEKEREDTTSTAEHSEYHRSCRWNFQPRQRWPYANSTVGRGWRRTPASRSPRSRPMPVAPLATSSGRCSRRSSRPGRASLTSAPSGTLCLTARRPSARGTLSQQPAVRGGGSDWSSRLSSYEPPSRWTPRSACPLSCARRRCWWALSRRARCWCRYAARARCAHPAAFHRYVRLCTPLHAPSAPSAGGAAARLPRPWQRCLDAPAGAGAGAAGVQRGFGGCGGRPGCGERGGCGERHALPWARIGELDAPLRIGVHERPRRGGGGDADPDLNPGSGPLHEPDPDPTLALTPTLFLALTPPRRRRRRPSSCSWQLRTGASRYSDGTSRHRSRRTSRSSRHRSRRSSRSSSSSSSSSLCRGRRNRSRRSARRRRSRTGRERRPFARRVALCSLWAQCCAWATSEGGWRDSTRRAAGEP